MIAIGLLIDDWGFISDTWQNYVFFHYSITPKLQL